ncbi:MAG: exodeoxyribonuclease VII large subunit, partial [Candidatus Nanopelagicales bacterium]
RFEIREVAVQGANAVREVTDALIELDAIDDVDVIVITRGGGSVEDLLPFSNESLVRAVSAASTPVVSAIGHEQDAPILDLVADYRASTPTDAGKRVVPSFKDEDARVRQLLERGRAGISRRLESEATFVIDAERRMVRVLQTRIDNWSNDVRHLLARTRSLSPAATLERGYAIVQRHDGAVVREAMDVKVGDALDIFVHEGKIRASVTERIAQGDRESA